MRQTRVLNISKKVLLRGQSIRANLIFQILYKKAKIEVRNLPSNNQSTNPVASADSTILNWSVSEVCNFVSSIDICREYAEVSFFHYMHKNIRFWVTLYQQVANSTQRPFLSTNYHPDFQIGQLEVLQIKFLQCALKELKGPQNCQRSKFEVRKNENLWC